MPGSSASAIGTTRPALLPFRPVIITITALPISHSGAVLTDWALHIHFPVLTNWESSPRPHEICVDGDSSPTNLRISFTLAVFHATLINQKSTCQPYQPVQEVDHVALRKPPR